MSVDPAAVAERLASVRDRIDRAGGGRPVAVVAVTKGFGADAVRAALALGLDAIGENYAQELLAKAEALAESVPSGLDQPAPGTAVARWHFLGRLQRNKVRHLARLVAVWESVDRPELVDELARRAPGTRVFVQANLSGEPQKGGASLDDVAALVARGRDAGLAVEGLMGVAPAGPPEAARPGFRRLVALAEELALPERSIGMSADLEVAVEEGATVVRVGRDLFGPRPPRVDDRG
ncbi:MAG TPA: YggS family pyridoxal phosphate enzyme [Acidimicrobiales bacterium]